MLSFAVRREGIDRNPLAGIARDLPAVVQRHERRGLTFEEVRRILPPKNDPLKVLWRFLYFTGAREGETLALEWKDVDLVGETVRFLAKNCKTDKPRVVPLNSEIRQELRPLRLRGSRARVFTTSEGKPWTPFALLRRFKSACKRAGVDLTGVCVHSPRHTLTSRLQELRYMDGEIMAISGHTTMTALRGYAHVSPERLRRTVEELNPEEAIVPPVVPANIKAAESA